MSSDIKNVRSMSVWDATKSARVPRAPAGGKDIDKTTFISFAPLAIEAGGNEMINFLSSVGNDFPDNAYTHRYLLVQPLFNVEYFPDMDLSWKYCAQICFPDVGAGITTLPTFALNGLYYGETNGLSASLTLNKMKESANAESYINTGLFSDSALWSTGIPTQNYSNSGTFREGHLLRRMKLSRFRELLLQKAEKTPGVLNASDWVYVHPSNPISPRAGTGPIYENMQCNIIPIALQYWYDSDYSNPKPEKRYITCTTFPAMMNFFTASDGTWICDFSIDSFCANNSYNAQMDSLSVLRIKYERNQLFTDYPHDDKPGSNPPEFGGWGGSISAFFAKGNDDWIEAKIDFGDYNYWEGCGYIYYIGPRFTEASDDDYI